MNDGHERIGDFLVRMKAITPEQATAVLHHQHKEPHKLFGQIAHELGFLKDQQMLRYLEPNRFG